MSPNSILRTILNALIKSLKSYLAKSALVVLAVSMMIWFVGPQIRYQDYAPFQPVLNRVIAIAVVIFLWGINNLIVVRHEARQKKPQDITVAPPRDPVEEEIEALRLSFRNAMKLIRDKWVGEERGSRSLYAMPWFVVMGPGASGKTSMIVEADLKFPISHLLGQINFKSVRATQKPQYWVTSESVLFDVPGSWTQPEKLAPKDDEEASQNATGIASGSSKVPPSREARLWQAFMDLLVEFRPRRPINGVILCLDIAEIVRSSDEDRINLASIIHGRLVELSDKLGTRFTVHVVLTKLDRFAGFREYFSLFSKTERVSPFGFSFPVYDEVSADKWVEEFETNFARFMEQHNDDLIDRLYSQRDVQARRNIYVFSRHLAAIGPIVIDFLRHALHSDRFSTPPLVRGVYSVSTKQEGVAFNALLSRISREHDMPPQILPAYSGHSSPYFTAELFRRVIFREAGLAGDNKLVERRKRLVFNGTVLASVLSVLTLGFFLNEAWKDNAARMDRVVSKTKDFVALPKPAEASSDVATLRPALDAIRSATEVFPQWRDAFAFQRYASLYQGGRVGPRVEETYEALLRDRYFPALATRLQAVIDKLGADPEAAAGDERLEALRAYLLLGDIGKRNDLDASKLTPQQATRSISDWMARDWQTSYEGDKTVQASLASHLSYGLEVFSLAAPLDAASIQRAQADLRRVPRDLRLFRSIEMLAHRQMPSGISFRTEIGPSFDLVFKQGTETAGRPSDVTIPAFLTKPGFLDFFVPQNDALSVVAVEDAWVAGERERVSYSEEDLEAFRKKVRHRYATAYIDAWYKAVNSLEIVDFKNVDHALLVLEEINGPANPFGRTLNLLKAQTEIYQQKSVEVDPKQATKAALPFDDNREQGLRINRSFAQLNAVITATDKEKPYFEELMTALQRLETYMREIRSGIASSKPVALDRARARASLQGDDPIYVLRRVAANLPEPLNKHLSKIADESWKVVLDAAKKDLQAQWQEQVYSHFNVGLATRYPFRADAKDDVSLEEFENFFGPKGAFETFFRTNLVTFINENTNQPVVIDGQILQISPHFLDELKRVRRIRQTFFDGKGAPTLQYTVEPVSLSQGLARSVLNIEGQLVPYSHGPSRPISILWPNALSSKQNTSQLSVFRAAQGNGTSALTFQGIWSGFRLLEKARVSNAQPESIDLTFDVGGNKALYRVRMATPDNPFLSKPLSALKLPETL